MRHGLYPILKVARELAPVAVPRGVADAEIGTPCGVCGLTIKPFDDVCLYRRSMSTVNRIAHFSCAQADQVAWMVAYGRRVGR